MLLPLHWFSRSQHSGQVFKKELVSHALYAIYDHVAHKCYHGCSDMSVYEFAAYCDSPYVLHFSVQIEFTKHLIVFRLSVTCLIYI